MFTGIVEEVGEVVGIAEIGTNRTLRIRAKMTPELRIDQSVAHNGVCLTVVAIEGEVYDVTVVDESLQRSNLGALRIGDQVNLERSLRIGDRLDGHMVQGHVDTTTRCLAVNDLDGSWSFVFELPDQKHFLVHKGSICINGVSLTIAVLDEWSFGVAIIPYTYEHTTFRDLEAEDRVNLEFDVLGKYVDRMLVRPTTES
ncbi:MAG: riboflavin synthase [Flavobacteriales bacterium]|jgi:riboflavin synthase|nr:riboflavin synthase [Flavobacteriales bacterium]MBK6881599.1 riboflavin synthase [Flavobacteriales bacterium]MBK7102915.1 riboflavin synthase [Flavobacteriales bacterium]MBK7113480.1 riboflavin synthase [Flavobacteriales bacterium]MBK7619708.1 riboflavin synthase [Flavobacteriales bacterium]